MSKSSTGQLQDGTARPEEDRSGAAASHTAGAGHERRVGTVSRLLAAVLALVVALVTLLSGATAAGASMTTSAGGWGSTHVQCFTDLNRAFFEVDVRGGTALDTVGAAVSSQRWNGSQWIVLSGSTSYIGTGTGTLYKGWWGPVSADGHYRHLVTYKWRDARTGITYNGQEMLSWGSYSQMRRTSTGGYLPTSAGYCTV